MIEFQPQDDVSRLAKKIENEGKELMLKPTGLAKELHDMPPEERQAVAKKIQEDAAKNGNIGKWNFTPDGELLSVEQKHGGSDERVTFDPKTGLKKSEDWTVKSLDGEAYSRHTEFKRDAQGRPIEADSKLSHEENGTTEVHDLRREYDPNTGRMTHQFRDDKEISKKEFLPIIKF